MDRDQVTMAFPRPGRALKALLILMAVLGVGGALLVNVDWGRKLFLALVATPETVLHGQVWRLFTAGLLTSPDNLSHLLFSLMGLYFLSPDLERRWGAARFLRFVLISNAAGFALSIAVDALSPPSAPGLFHQKLLFGPYAALTATAVAWAMANATQTVRLFFFLPVTGKQFFWFTLAMCVLGVIYPSGVTEGPLSPFGGFLAGMLLGGSPSVLRSLYLKTRLALLKRQASSASDAPPSTRRRTEERRRRPEGGPALRVVPGGLEDELRKRRPPKDKRYLN